MSAIFAKLHSLHSKEKEPRGHQAKVHISQKKNQRRPSQDFTSRRTRIKSTTIRPLKLNHEILGGLSMGNPTAPHRPYYREVGLGNKAHNPIAKKNTEQSNVQN